MRNIYRIFMIACLFLCCYSGQALAAGGEPSVRASVDRRAILIGDKIIYKIEVGSPKGTEIELPKFKDQKAGDFEIKDSGSKTEKLFFGGKKYTEWYGITSYTPGKYKTPVGAVRFKNTKTGDWKAKGLNQIDIEVDSVLPRDRDASDIKDIKGPIRPFEINYWLIGGLLAAAAAAIAMVRAYIRYRNRVPPKTPYELALSELGEAELLLQSTGDIKEYYVRISDSIRRYIESVFRLHAPEMTTQEFLYSLRDSGFLPGEYKDLMKDFMEACDLVKFAKYVPAKKEAESVLTTAKNFVEGTKGVLTEEKGKK